MAVKKNKKTNKYSGKTKTKKLDDVVLKNSQEQLKKSSPEIITRKKITESKLKKLYIKKKNLFILEKIMAHKFQMMIGYLYLLLILKNTL